MDEKATNVMCDAAGTSWTLASRRPPEKQRGLRYSGRSQLPPRAMEWNTQWDAEAYAPRTGRCAQVS